MNYNEQRFLLVLRITRIVSSVVFYLFWVIGGLSLLSFFGLLLFNPGFLTIQLSEVANLVEGFDYYGVSILDVVGDQQLSLRLPLLLISLAVATVIGIGIWILLQLRGLLTEVKDNRPFTSRNATRLFYIAYSILALSVLSPVFTNVVTWSVERQLSLPSSNSFFFFGFNIGYLFVAALLYLLAHLFQYGAHLQAEVDTTV